MDHVRTSRLACIVVSLFPALWGLFSLLNNVSDFSDTARQAVAPLLSMQDTYHVPGQMWRALSASWAPLIGLGFITLMETLAGMLAATGIVVMLKNFRRNYADFARAKAWAIAGACCAILVWGIGFMVVAGDWFMAWEAKTAPLSTQLGAMMYTLPCMLALGILMLHREEE